MGKSSGFSIVIEGFVVAAHGPENGDAAARESDEGLGVGFPLAALSVVMSLRERIPRAHRAAGALEEDAP